MPCMSPKRVAALAVRRYGADRARVRDLCRTILEADGDADDLLQALLVHGVITGIQAGELRQLMEAEAGELSSVEHEPRSQSVHGEDDEPPTLLDCRTAIPEITESDLALEDVPLSGGPEPTRIGGFRILHRLGDGSMGAVYLGYHEVQDRHVAIKVLADHLALNETCVERFYRESKCSLLLNHPHIVRGYSAAYDDVAQKHYLVREFIDGLSAQALLERVNRFPVGTAVHATLDVALALVYLQERDLVHRDIKPDNILITRCGAAKLADLGLLKRSGDRNSRVRLGKGSGTSFYMPHEQALDAHRVDGRSDIYALGATLYHLLTGEVPFPGGSHHEIVEKKATGAFRPASALNPAVPPELDAILSRMLALQPNQRYGSAAELVADLEGTGLAVAPTEFPELNGVLLGYPAPFPAAETGQKTRPDYDTPLPVDVLELSPPTEQARPWSALLVRMGLALAVITLLGVVLTHFVLES
ncbi:MAG: serine/threonine protein kinase [Planctomycetia bacterium]|nr:serine/threonine protein kinase [Planctomycetia bacterium]